VLLITRACVWCLPWANLRCKIKISRATKEWCDALSAEDSDISPIGQPRAQA
jgi:hypothetical protein